MPCHQIQTCNVELKNADHELLQKGLETAGYKATYNEKQKQLSFSRDQVSGYHKNHVLHIEAPEGAEVDVNEIRRAYSQEVVNKRAREFQAKGWVKTQVGNKVTFTKPQAQSQTVGFRR